jgi:hypothetical protein
MIATLRQEALRVIDTSQALRFLWRVRMQTEHVGPTTPTPFQGYCSGLSSQAIKAKLNTRADLTARPRRLSRRAAASPLNRRESDLTRALDLPNS